MSSVMVISVASFNFPPIFSFPLQTTLYRPPISLKIYFVMIITNIYFLTSHFILYITFKRGIIFLPGGLGQYYN